MLKRRLSFYLAAALVLSSVFVAPQMSRADEIEIINEECGSETPVEENEDTELSENSINAQEATVSGVDGDYQYEVVEGIGRITKYNGTDESVTIPRALGGYKMSWIYAGALSSNAYLKNVVIGDNITAIRNDAFRDCSHLETVTMTDNVTYIGQAAFYGCHNLKEIDLPDNLRAIRNFCFFQCRSLKKVDIPESVTGIYSAAFSDCEELKEIKLPSDIEYIGSSAFYNCKSIKKVSIPKNIKEIESGVFAGCSSLKKVDFSEAVNLTELAHFAFGMCAIEEIDIPDSVETIGDKVFAGDLYLKAVKLPESLTEIIRFTFYDSTNIRKIYIPSGVKKIGKQAFWPENNLKDIYYGGSKSDWEKIDIDDENSISDDVVIHYNSTAEDYKKGNDDKRDSDGPYKPIEETDPDDSSSETISENRPGSTIVRYNDISVSYNNTIVFNGKKKLNAESFGTITISYNGSYYTAGKISVSKKKQKFRITKITPKEKSLQKEVKKLTKGDNGLAYTVKPYTISDNSIVDAKFNKSGKLKSVKITIGNNKYKCKKAEYNYDSATAKINFSGDNLTGSYSVSSN